MSPARIKTFFAWQIRKVVKNSCDGGNLSLSSLSADSRARATSSNSGDSGGGSPLLSSTMDTLPKVPENGNVAILVSYYGILSRAMMSVSMLFSLGSFGVIDWGRRT